MGTVLDPETRARAYAQFAPPQVPEGWHYEAETGRTLPAGTHSASWTRVLAGVALGFALFVGTLGVGYLAWSFATWRQGQTPAQRLLGLRCWLPDTWEVPGRRQMAVRQFIGLCFNGEALMGLIFVLLGWDKTSAGDFVVGTVVRYDPDGVLLTFPRKPPATITIEPR